MSERRISNRTRTIATGAVLSTLVAGIGVKAHEDNSNHLSLPSCEITIKEQGTFLAAYNAMGDHQPGDTHVYEADGSTPVSSNVLAAPQLYIQPGMIVESNHVKPNVCDVIGGAVIFNTVESPR